MENGYRTLVIASTHSPEKAKRCIFQEFRASSKLAVPSVIPEKGPVMIDELGPKIRSPKLQVCRSMFLLH